MKAAVGITVTVTDEHDELLTPDALEDAIDQVTDELVKLDVEDATVGGTLSTGVVEISVVVEAATLTQAWKMAFSRIRTAIHAAGGGTPGWEPGDEPSDDGGWCTEVDGFTVQKTEDRDLVGV